MGWGLSFARFGAMAGPMIGGYAESIGLSLTWHFGIFAIVAFVAALAVILIPARPEATAGEPLAGTSGAVLNAGS